MGGAAAVAANTVRTWTFGHDAHGIQRTELVVSRYVQQHRPPENKVHARTLRSGEMGNDLPRMKGKHGAVRLF